MERAHAQCGECVHTRDAGARPHTAFDYGNATARRCPYVARRMAHARARARLGELRTAQGVRANAKHLFGRCLRGVCRTLRRRRRRRNSCVVNQRVCVCVCVCWLAVDGQCGAAASELITRWHGFAARRTLDCPTCKRARKHHFCFRAVLLCCDTYRCKCTAMEWRCEHCNKHACWATIF